jgi:hypothetical protein
MKKYNSYTFLELQQFLNQDTGKHLIVKNEKTGDTAVMHVFRENFCGGYVSGDGILFYADGEVHSANESDKFILIDIIKLSYNK